MKALEHESIKNRYNKLAPNLNEKTRRYWVAVEAEELGYGGIAAVSRATGMTPKAIRRGIKELKGEVETHTDRQRAPGGGRKPVTETQPRLLEALDKLVEPYTSGDPESPLRWTCKSTYNLAEELKKQGFSSLPIQ